jgi:protein involved in polysaccharide export with SLBB domain
LSKVKVDELTNQQIQEFQKRVQASGMTQQQLESVARSKGMSETEIQKLKSRMMGFSSQKDTTATKQNRKVSVDDVFDLKSIKIAASSKKIKSDTTDLLSKRIFGYYLFNSNNLTFEPSSNAPTPRNYLLSAGDELTISVWGASQNEYTTTVNTEGYISIPNVGLIFVNGLTIEKASEIIKSRLKKIYSGIGTNTYALVSVSKIRSINISIVGEARIPGSYNLSSVSSVFNALYVCGGSNSNGSFRNIKVLRGNKVVSEIDVYRYLLKGEKAFNIKLLDQDVILIPEYTTRVQVSGEVKRPLIYEVQQKENLSDIITYAGGFTDKAYTHRIKIYRNSSREKQIFDVPGDSLKSFGLANGDSIVVEPILNRYENMVQISGAVYREGKYSLDKNLTIKGLIEKAEGLRGDAFLQRAIIYRTNANLKVEAIQVNLETLMTGSANDILLLKNDSVKIFTLRELEEDYNVSIFGEVRLPGIYPFVESLSLADFIAQSGGFLESATSSRIEVARRISGQNQKASDSLAIIYVVDLDEDLQFSGNKGDFLLKPFDQVYVRKSPNYREQKVVAVAGEVNFPGTYAIQSREEKFSDLIQRTGGFTPYAYLKGARLLRKYNPESKLNVIKKYGEKRDSLIKLDTEIYQAIGLNVEKIIDNPGSKYDIILEPGDSIVIPKELQTVGVNGAVLYPIQAKYNANYSFSDYVSQSGGFAENAQKRRAFVIYANGSVKKTNSFLGMKFYPRIEPGAEIIIPRKPMEKKMSIQETVAITSALASIASVVVAIMYLVK